MQFKRKQKCGPGFSQVKVIDMESKPHKKPEDLRKVRTIRLSDEEVERFLKFNKMLGRAVRQCLEIAEEDMKKYER